MTLDYMFNRLWTDYTNQNPSAQQIHDLFTGMGEEVQNDHIAFRTFNDPRIRVDVLAKAFTDRGYTEKGTYRFESKHLSAKHYEIPGMPEAPRVFISELILEEFGTDLQDTVRLHLDNVDPSVFEREDLIFAGSIFDPVGFRIYERLREESEYAAWLLVHGFRVNHFTVSVNALQNLQNIEQVNHFLIEHGFTLNTSGGEVKGSEQQLLKQSSTLAEIIKREFSDGVHEIPACYYEFAERFRDGEGQLFSGFIAGSADRIFESTDYYTK